MQRLSIALIDEELPFPLTSGKRIRTFNLLSRLADRHRITLICHRNASSSEADEAREAFRKLGIETRIVDHRVPRKSGPSFYARLGANLLSPLPYSVSSHTSSALVDEVRRHSLENQVDVWHCEWTPYANVLRRAFGEQLRETRWLVMAHNIESLIWQRYVEAEKNSLIRSYIWLQWKKFCRFERWAFSTATVSVAVSPEDAQLMRKEFGGVDPMIVENGVDTSFFSPQSGVRRDPSQILFLGSLDWRPNLDGIRLLLDDVFPRVRAQVSSARLALVGRNPPQWLRDRVAGMSDVDLLADVPDVRPHLAACGMLAVPLRIGGGSRLKILEALATETPVVSTRIGAEGLNLVAGRDLVVVEGPEEMAGAIVQGIRAPEELQATARRGCREVNAQYDWQLLGERLDAAWRRAAGHGGGMPGRSD